MSKFKVGDRVVFTHKPSGASSAGVVLETDRPTEGYPYMTLLDDWCGHKKTTMPAFGSELEHEEPSKSC
jgi:hypothetical protein